MLLLLPSGPALPTYSVTIDAATFAVAGQSLSLKLARVLDVSYHPFSVMTFGIEFVYESLQPRILIEAGAGGDFILLQAGETVDIGVDWTSKLGDAAVASSRWVIGPLGPILSSDNHDDFIALTRMAIQSADSLKTFTLKNIIQDSTGLTLIKNIVIRTEIGTGLENRCLSINVATYTVVGVNIGFGASGGAFAGQPIGILLALTKAA